MDTGWAEQRYVQVLLDAATAKREHGDARTAQALLEKALELSRKERNPSRIAAVRASQGVLERIRGNLDTAGERLAEALRLRRELADSLGIARALGDLARVHLEAGRSEDAERCILEALEVSAPHEPGRTRAEVLEHAGRFHAKLGSPDRAEACFDEAREIYESLGDRAAVERLSMPNRAHTVSEQVPRNLDEELGGIERRRLLDALDAEGWNQSRAARRLGVTETRVRNLMRRHGLRPRNRRGRPRKVTDDPST